MKNQKPQEELNDLFLRVLRENKKLIESVARRYSGIDPSLDYEDLLSEAYLAMVNALSNFEEGKKTSFTSYLFWHLQKKFQTVLGGDKVVEVEVNGEKRVLSYSEFIRIKRNLPEGSTFRVMTLLSSFEELLGNGNENMVED